MLRPTSIRLYERTKRLISERFLHQKEEELTKEALRKTRNPSLATLTGRLQMSCVAMLWYGTH